MGNKEVEYKRKKTVLIIAPYYPPCVITASKRTACFAKYLIEYGWNVIVVCKHWTSDNCVYDPEFVTNIPKKVIVTTVICENEQRSLFSKIREFFFRVFFPHFYPLLFLENGKKVLHEIFEKYDIDVIFATAPFASAHVLASWASKMYKKPWVADFRDIVNQFFISIKSSMVVPFRLLHEKRYIKNTSLIITVSNGLASKLKARYKQKVCIIPNGFDPEDFNTSDN